MEAIVEDVVSVEDLKKFEKVYNEQSLRGPVSPKAQFEYAYCLVRCKSQSEIRHGLALLEDLFHKTADQSAKRDYLFYMAIGNTRIKEYQTALKYVKGIQQVQPGNHQAKELEAYIKNKMKKDGLLGIAIVGGAAALVIGGLTAIGIAASKK